MLRDYFNIPLLFFFFFTSIVFGQTVPVAPIGDGSEETPYLISSVAEFKWIADVVNTGTLTNTSSFFKQTQDIDFNGQTLTPIGIPSNKFEGVYDGNGHSLLNITMNETTDMVGIFGGVNNGIIKNLKVDNANISVQLDGYSGAGILIGSLYSDSTIYNVENVTIESSTISSTNSNNGYVGGLIGRASNSKIINTNVDAEVNTILNNSAGGANIGGFIGRIDSDVFIKHSSSSGTVNTNGWRSGGFLGSGSGSSTTIEECFSTSEVIGGDYGQGGFVGHFYQGTIKNCYSIGDISIYPDLTVSSDWVGSFFGFGQSSPNYENNYGTGSLPTKGYGFGGYSNVVNGEDNFFDTTTTGTTTALKPFYSGTLNATLNGVTTSEMKTKSTFTDEGWDFINVWDIHSSVNNGYPFLINTISNPIVKISSAQTTINSTAPVNINFTITESINDFDLSDISLSGNGSIGSVLTQVSSTTYMVAYTAPADQTGTVTITVNDSTFTGGPDGLNNYGDSLVLSYDTTSPEVDTFTSSDINLNSSEEANLAVTLTQSSTTFLQSDIILESSGATTGFLSVFSAVNSKTYSLLYTPPSNFSGTVTLTIPVNSFENTDSPAKSNTQTSTLVLNIDTTAPEISTLSHTHSDLVVRDVNTVPFSLTFTESMAVSPKISIGSLVTNASMTISPSTNSQTWTYDWNVPSGNDGIVSATVSATDLFGNYYEGTDSITFTIDNVSPTITLTENDADDILLLGESTLFTASVNETVSGVPTMTIETTIGTTNDVLTAAGADWTYSYTAPSNYSGVVSFTVSLLDVAGNLSTATKTLTVDSVTASLTLISSPNANGKYTDNDNNPANSDTISITLTFSEEVAVSSSIYPYLTLNTLPSQNAFYSGGSGTQTLTFSYMVMDGGETADLGVTNIVLPTGAFIKDLAGNPAELSLVALNASSDNLSDTKDIEIRAKDPTLTTLTAATNNGTTNFGATDGNTVTYNFTSDIDLLSSSVSMTFNSFPSQPTLTQSNSGNTYTLSFTVDANTPEGALQFNLFATDTHSSTLVPEENRTADYTQSAFNQILIIDRTAPVITSTALTTPENSITGPTVVANEAVFSFSLTGGADQALFTINPTTGVLSFVNAPDFEAPADSNADNIYDLDVRVTDIVGLTATQTIAVTVTDVSDTFGVDLRATEAQTTEEGGNSVVSVALFTQPTAAVTLNFSSSDTTEGIPSLSQMVFTTDNWNIDQTLNMTGQDDQDIDGNVAYNLLVSSVSSSDANYNSLTGISLGFVNVDNEIDTDGDGFFDYQDAFPTDPLEWLDTDSDGIGNNADLDDDGDGFSDITEITCGSNSLDATDIPLDSDDDGVLDCQDEDDDNDGIMDSIDNCQFTPNIDQIDTDGDGQGDVCDSDDDNDGYLDTEDAFPLNATEWLDTDSDGTGNNADTDDDNDGQSDTDEIACGSDPLLASSMSLDTDGDTIPDCVDTDDDNDGVVDTEDAFPLDPSEWTDTDSDGIGNNADLDDDNDGQSDYNELVCGSDPLDQYSKSSDIDSDSIPDCVDPDRDGDGYLNTEDVFPDNPREWLDSDGDGLGDNFDVDDDNDGCLDSSDAFPLNPSECSDADNDGIGDNEDPDDNNDGFEDNKLFASGALTPGSGGLEDTWKIINIERYPNARVTVYNKNGQEVFSALAYRNDWRGTFKNTGDLLPSASYYYIVDPNNGEKALKGWLFITY